MRRLRSGEHRVAAEAGETRHQVKPRAVVQLVVMFLDPLVDDLVGRDLPGAQRLAVGGTQADEMLARTVVVTILFDQKTWLVRGRRAAYGTVNAVERFHSRVPGRWVFW